MIGSRWCARAARAPMLTIAAALLMLALAPGGAVAAPQELRLVVAGPDDSAAHRLAEILTDPLAQVLGLPVMVQDVPGAGGTAAAQTVVEAAPDGGTLLLANNLLLAENEAA